MRFLSWLRGESRREYYYRKRLKKVEDQIRYRIIEEEAKELITEFEDEETLGFAILQRQRRLENEKKTTEEQQQQQQQKQQSRRRQRCERCQYQKEMCSACYEASQAADVPPPYLDRTPKDLELDLAKLREEFSKHRTRLEAKKEELKDSDSWWTLYALVPRWHKDDAGRTFEWVKARRKCADSGGCCGRTCGCCEEVLFEYQRPISGSNYNPEMVRVKVHGHCTAECACCIKFWGFYTPHPALPTVCVDR